MDREVCCNSAKCKGIGTQQWLNWLNWTDTNLLICFIFFQAQPYVNVQRGKKKKWVYSIYLHLRLMKLLQIYFTCSIVSQNMDIFVIYLTYDNGGYSVCFHFLNIKQWIKKHSYTYIISPASFISIINISRNGLEIMYTSSYYNL